MQQNLFTENSRFLKVTGRESLKCCLSYHCCLCSFTMCKEYLKCVIFLKASNNFKKGSVFQTVNFMFAR